MDKLLISAETAKSTNVLELHDMKFQESSTTFPWKELFGYEFDDETLKKASCGTYGNVISTKIHHLIKELLSKNITVQGKCTLTFEEKSNPNFDGPSKPREEKYTLLATETDTLSKSFIASEIEETKCLEVMHSNLGFSIIESGTTLEILIHKNAKLIIDRNIYTESLLKCFERLENCIVKSDVSGEVINIKGHVVILGSVFTDKEVTISGVDEAELKIVTSEGRQPCIGPESGVNLSYGRWHMASHDLEHITVDNVKVVCEHNKYNTFNIGKYGGSSVPAVIHKNGGDLICPELLHVRLLVRDVTYHAGSTKLDDDPVYILTDGDSADLCTVPDDVKEYYEEIKKLSSKMALHVSVFTSPKGARYAAELLKLNPDCNVELLLTKEGAVNVTTAASACVLGLHNKYTPIEFKWSVAKLDHFMDMYYNNPDRARPSLMPYMSGIAHHLFGDNFDALTPWQIRYIYELIPEYEFNFSGKSNEQCARELFDMQFIPVEK